MTRRSGKRPDRVTLDDIASRLHITVKTASLALRAHPSVAQDTATKAQELAASLGYTARREHRRVIGIVTPYVSHYTHSELINIIRDLIFSYGDIILIGETTGNPTFERRVLSELGNKGAQGIIVISPRLPSVEIENISRFKHPIVTVNLNVGSNSHLDFGSVEIDFASGAYDAVKYLYTEGHRSIAYLAGRPPSISDRQRRSGYSRGIREFGIEHCQRMIIEMTGNASTAWPDWRAGYSQCEQLISLRLRPDAILAYNDLMALGAVKFLWETGIRVPEDISVVGFDNVSICNFCIPPLTTVGVQWEAVGLMVCNTLFHMMGRETEQIGNQIHHVINPELFFRKSVLSRMEATPNSPFA